MNNTIAAISTAMTDGGIGIVRISGEDAFEVADKIFRTPKGTKKISEMESHTVHYGFIVDGDEVVDEVMLLVLKAPNTYTREDTIEIDTHGGVLVTKKVLMTALKNGCRPAEPGEFTKRAFLNGRIDLSQAESVIDVINAKNDMALKSSIGQLRGSVRDKISEIRAVILNELAFIESALDDPEHYTLDGYYDVIKEKIEDLVGQTDKLISSFKNGKVLKEGICTAIVGRPNAGKSSVLNNLLGEDRAIVTDIAGTTRDVLEEQIKIGQISLNIADTAGIRDTDDVVEKIGVSRSKDYIEKADLVLYVVDSSSELDENDQEIIEAIRDKKAIILLNKSDLQTVTEKGDITKLIDKPVVNISALMNTGMDELSSLIEEMFFEGNISFNDEVYITNIRHEQALIETRESLNMVLGSIENMMPEDFLTIDMMNAYERLGVIIGEAVEEDLVNEIFSKFCMGK